MSGALVVEGSCAGRPIPKGEQVAFPENAYDGPYKMSLEADVVTNTCALGRNLLDIWASPPFALGDSDGYVGVENTVITPAKEPDVIVRAMLTIPREHTSGVEHLTGTAFQRRAHIMSSMISAYGLPSMWGERFGDNLSGKTQGHAHSQEWWLVPGSRKPFMIGTYENQPYSMEVLTRADPGVCRTCQLLASGELEEVNRLGDHVLYERKTRRLDVEGEMVAHNFIITTGRHLSPGESWLTGADFFQRGCLFQLAVKEYGFTGGGIFESLADGPAHTMMEVVVPRRSPTGRGVAVVFTAGAHPL